MADLVVVESPAKAKTIEKYLGDGWRVLASYGHVRDLPKSDFAVLTDDGPDAVALKYEVPKRSKDHVSALRKAAKDAETVWLATDLDREGEAIGWHVAELLKLDVASTPRVVFDEITKGAILAAFDTPRTLDTDLVDAQQARRAVDRIVGYRLSPVLWRTVSAGISAGRVQSVALRLIVDREDEIRAFVPDEYWTFEGTLLPGDDAPEDAGDAPVGAKLWSFDDLEISTPKTLEGASDAKIARSRVVATEAEADVVRAGAESVDTYTVRSVTTQERKRNPKDPLKTSTLQGEASKIGFTARQTMAVAQQLYEGMDVGEGEAAGLITYMRTDSLNLSDGVIEQILQHVTEAFGQEYAVDEPRRATTETKGAQEAHEAIRPTSIGRTPDAVRQYLTAEQLRLYTLIWQRTVATQMTPAVFDRVTAEVAGIDAEGRSVVWRVSGQVEKFDGWMRAYRAVLDEDEQDEDDLVSDALPRLVEGQVLTLADLEATQSFTSPPPRFSERTLVETLEDKGIGRPSTYASIISTLEARDYVRKESRRFFTTPLGEVVVAFLKQHFAEIVDVEFTSRMEETLDEIAAGAQQWGGTVTAFLDEVDTWVKERKPERPAVPIDDESVTCPVCEGPMEKKFSGKSKQWFASCIRFPDCDGTRPIDADGEIGEPEPEPEPDEDVRCPEDGAPMVLRSGKFGPFFGCVNYNETGKAKCSGIRNVVDQCVFKDEDGDWQRFVSMVDGTSSLQKRTSRYGKWFVGSTGYPDDQYAIWSIPTAQPCPTCGAPVRRPPGNRNDPIAACANPEVEHLWELPDFDPPFVRTRKIVEGVEKFDPALGGTAIEEAEDYEPYPMEPRGEREPAAKKRKKKQKKAAKQDD